MHIKTPSFAVVQVASRCFCIFRACNVSVGYQGLLFFHLSVFPQFSSILVTIWIALVEEELSHWLSCPNPLSEDGVSTAVYCAVVNFFLS